MQNQSTKGLAADIRTFREKISAFWSAVSGQSSDFNTVAYYNNPNSLNDNILKWTWLFLIGASGYTLYTGYEYHISVFQNPYKAGLFFLLGEVAKVTFSLLFLRSLFSGLYFRGLPHLILGLSVLAFIVGAFWWSIDITADKYAKDKSAYEYGDALQKKTDIKALTADIDAQIAANNAMAKSGSTSTWKGKITGDGLEVMKDNARANNKLLKQRELMILEAIKNDSIALAGQMAVITDNMKQRNLYGGIAEIVVIFAVFFIALLEMICYRENKELIAESNEKQLNSTPQEQLFKIFQLAKPNTTPSVTTADERPKIGFKYGEAQSVITDTAEKSVITPVITVITENQPQTVITGASVITATVRKLIQDLNTECRNYETGNGKADSIIKRMRPKYAELKKTVDENKQLLNDTMLENYKNAMDRAYSITVDYVKQGGQS